MASCLYYSGDVDAAIDQLTRAVKDRPTSSNALFNIGMIKYQSKSDPKGAIAEWQQLLRAHLDLACRAVVEQMIERC